MKLTVKGDCGGWGMTVLREKQCHLFLQRKKKANQANALKARICKPMKKQVQSLWKDRWTINHVPNECCELAWKEYKRCLD